MKRSLQRSPGTERRAAGRTVGSSAGGEKPLPFVFLNMAMTADGKIATANRGVSSFGSGRDRRHLLELRATADAVMAGARTVDLNPVNLGPGPLKYRQMRRAAGLQEYNVRLIVSRKATIDPDAKIFKHRFSPIVILTTQQAPRKRVERLRSLADIRVFGTKEIDFAAAFRWLRAEHGVQRLLCEGGGELNDALFRAGLVDELHLTICPFIFGGRSAPTIADGLGASTLARSVKMELVSSRRARQELFLVYRTVRNNQPGGAGPGSIRER